MRANELYNQGKSQIAALDIDLKKLNQEKKQIQVELASIQKLRNEIEDYNRKASRADQEIENRKVKIVAFQEATNGYTLRLKELESETTAIVSKGDKIDELVFQAERALNLQSAVGISAAFSSYYEAAKENATFKIYKFKFNWWIVGAFFFLLMALGVTIWIVGGWYIEKPDSVSSIVGRIVAVSISITGATFCARQYVGQKNIQEDYAYKSVLSKSIIAFKEEIRKRDDAKVVDYLTTVLAEIHKDPLRNRNELMDKRTPELLDKIFDIVMKKQ
jgi:DNA repair exonuclease SbcCD ATPase subunit